MKVLIISDVHANLEALLATEKYVYDKKKIKIDKVWFLGDVPDRGPNPVESLQWLNEHVDVENWMMGNHDAYVLDLARASDIEGVDPKILETNERQKKEILSSGVDLSSFSKAHTEAVIKRFANANYILTHGSPRDPVGHNRTIFGWTTSALLEDEYRVLKNIVGTSGDSMICFFGHTHIPCLISLEENGSFTHKTHRIEYFKTYKLNEAQHWLINPGSIGSPRDLNYWSACAVLNTDTNEIIFYRVPYNVEKTASKLLKKGYDILWADRLIEAEPPGETPEFWIKYFKKSLDKEKDDEQ